MSLEQTQRRRHAVGTIHDIVGAMRAIAAGRIQGAQRALAAARRYEEVVQTGIWSLLSKSEDKLLPTLAGRPPLVVVLTAEQPFCGNFNQDVLALAQQRYRELSNQGSCHLVVVGLRGARQLVSRAIVPNVAVPAATTLPGVRDVVKNLARMIDRRFATGELGALHVIFNRYLSVSEHLSTDEQILPLDVANLQERFGRRKADYFRYLPEPVLLAGLISEYAFISLYRMASDSYASEQASRLVAMDGATRNTEKMLDTLRDLEHRERQGEITKQVLDLIGSRFASG